MFGLKPLMTKYEFCLLCADSYEAEGNITMRDIYRKLMSELSLKEAGENI
jgi:hypothetical protein